MSTLSRRQHHLTGSWDMICDDVTGRHEEATSPVSTNMPAQQIEATSHRIKLCLESGFFETPLNQVGDGRFDVHAAEVATVLAQLLCHGQGVELKRLRDQQRRRPVATALLRHDQGKWIAKHFLDLKQLIPQPSQLCKATYKRPLISSSQLPLALAFERVVIS